MNSVASEIQAVTSCEASIVSMAVSEIKHEAARLRHLRAEARRLNEAAFRDALAEAEAKAPALVPSNAMMRYSEIEQARAEIENESRVIGPELLEVLNDRISLLRDEISRRRSTARAA